MTELVGTATSLESVGISYLCAKRNNSSTLSATSARGQSSSTCRDYKLWTVEKPQYKVIEGLRLLIQHDLIINPSSTGLGGHTGSLSPSDTVSSMSLNTPICCASSQGTLTTFVRSASVMRSIFNPPIRGLSCDCWKLTVKFDEFYPPST